MKALGFVLDVLKVIAIIAWAFAATVIIVALLPRSFA